MTVTKFWLKIYGIDPENDRNPLLAAIVDAIEHMPNGHQIRNRDFDKKPGVMTVFFETQHDRDCIVKRIVKLGDEALLKYPLRVGKEEWSIPHDTEALMVLSTKGISCD